MKEKRKDPAIADRCQLEEALLESQQILEGIINAIPVRVFWKDENLVYLGCNTIFARDAGFTDPKDIIGKDDYQMGWRDQAELYRSDDRQVIESGRSKLLIEEPQTTPEGNTITLLTSKIPLRSSEGRIIGVLGTYMDITDRKRAEEALRESQKRFQALTETMNDFVWEMDARGAFTYCSPQINQIWGYKPEEMIGRRPFDLVIPEGRDEAIQAFRAILEPPRSFNGMVFKCRNRDGRIVVLEINGIPFIDIEGGLRGFRGIARDRRKTTS